MKDNVVIDKSYALALKIVRLYLYLKEHKKEFELSRQILKSGTSIAANIEEAVGGQSERDFLSKISIAYKECRETIFWLKLLRDSDLIDSKEAESLMPDLEELQKIISSIKKTMTQKLQPNNNL
ncbi:MAG: four helix bundle protein [Bacteroidales bacterium]|jgi:four helix bundle protein|nr:four helix bundle protein [Bacteroidales bacterium]